MASMMPFLGAAAGNAMQAYDQSNYRNKMMDLQEQRLDQAGKLDERRMDLTEQQIAAHKDQAEKQELKDVLGTFMTINEMTSDADRPKLVDQWNSVIVPRFSKYGIPTINSLNRKGKFQYNLKTGTDGKEYAIGISDQGDLSVKPVTLPGGAAFSEQEKPISVRDNEMLLRPGSGEEVYKGPQYGKDKPEKPEKEWVFNPKTRVKREVTQPLADELVGKHGWQRGSPTGSPPGELGDSAVLENIRELAQYDQAKTAAMWSQYQKRREEGMDRGKALESVQNEMVSEQEVSRLSELHGKFPDAESIRKAYKNKTISPEDAQLLLQSFHGDEYE